MALVSDRGDSWKSGPIGRVVAEAGLRPAQVARALGRGYASTWSLLTGRKRPSLASMLVLWGLLRLRGVDGDRIMQAMREAMDCSEVIK